MVCILVRTVENHLHYEDKCRFYMQFSCAGTTYKSLAHLEWSPKDVIEVTVVSVYQYSDNLLVKLNCELLTPFENWRRTSVSGGYEIYRFHFIQRHHHLLLYCTGLLLMHICVYPDYSVCRKESSDKTC
jgi:hypothetical protein